MDKKDEKTTKEEAKSAALRQALRQAQETPQEAPQDATPVEAATTRQAPTPEPTEEEQEPKKAPWARLLSNLAHSGPASKEKEVEKRLRANDINTYQDASRNPNVVINILRDVYGADFGRLMSAAKEYEDAHNRQ